MKKAVVCLLCLITGIITYAQVAINTNGNAPAASAMLDVSSTNKGLLMPRMTSEQRKAIAAPETGLFVYDTDKQTPYMFDGYKWRPLSFTAEGNLPLVERDVPGGFAQGQLGWTVAINGNTAAAFSHQDTVAGLSYAGSVSVFSKESGNWKFITRLTPPVPQSSGYFGEALAIENDVLVIGQQYYNKPGKPFAGNVYIYKKVAGNWKLVQELSGSKEMANAWFGSSVAIHNGRIAVGAFGQTVNGIAGNGAVYVFKYNGSNYVEEKILEPQMGTAAGVGKSVALHNTHLLAGAPSGKQGAVKCGVAVLYTLAANTQQWIYTSTWAPSQVQEGMRFGQAVSLFNDRAIVGAPSYNISAITRGCIEQFKKAGNTWSDDGFISGSSQGSFGNSVAVFETGYMVASYTEKGGRVHLFDWEKSFPIKVYKDHLSAEGEKSDRFGFSIAVHNGHFIIGIPNKTWGDKGAVQFGTID